MGQSADKVVRRLERAHRERSWVAIRLTSSWPDNAKYGRVLALTEKWVVVHTLIHGFYLDDVAIFRLKDIKSVGKDPEPEFRDRVVAGLGVPVATFDAEPAATLSDLLRTVAERAELVMTYRRVTPDFRHVTLGKLRKVGATEVEWHNIDGDGTWAESWARVKVKQIERVEFGGRYITAFERFGDPLPPDDDDDSARASERD